MDEHMPVRDRAKGSITQGDHDNETRISCRRGQVRTIAAHTRLQGDNAMLFVVMAENRPGTAQLRLDTVDAHVTYLDAHKDRFVASGPMLSDDGQEVNGTFLVLDMPDRQALDRFMADEPYNRAGVLGAIDVRRWKFGRADTNRYDRAF